MASFGEVPTENLLLAEFKAKKELRPRRTAFRAKSAVTMSGTSGRRFESARHEPEYRGRSVRISFPARWTRPSTNATCQPEKPEIQHQELWPPVLDGAVNKRNLSSGETGEFASENLESGLNPGG